MALIVDDTSLVTNPIPTKMSPPIPEWKTWKIWEAERREGNSKGQMSENGVTVSESSFGAIYWRHL